MVGLYAAPSGVRVELGLRPPQITSSVPVQATASITRPVGAPTELIGRHEPPPAPSTVAWALETAELGKGQTATAATAKQPKTDTASRTTAILP